MQYNRAELGLGGGSLLQAANRTLTQMMCYIIETPAGETLVIDGGNRCKEEADFLYEQIRQRGGRVHGWFFTHAHSDHVGALTQLLETHPNLDIQIDRLYFHFPDRAWLAAREEPDSNARFFAAIEKHGLSVTVPCAGDVYAFGGVSVEILSHPVDYEAYPTINPTSMILRVHFPKRDVLFLGDLDIYAQEEVLQTCDEAKLRCDIVQMAHHGQGGVNRAFYAVVRPKICLYPTPKWLWENNLYRVEDPATAGKGHFKTFETRKWMDELGAVSSYTQAEGDWLFV